METYDALIALCDEQEGFPAEAGSLDTPDSRSELKMDHLHADGASRALDAIRSGGEHLLVTIRQRMVLIYDCIDEGDFHTALSYAGDIQSSLASLASAQTYIAIADGSRLIKAADVEVGMTVVNVGEVTDVSVEDCPNERCKRHVTLKVGEHEMAFRGEQEVYVAAA
jgi:hypothetical protein